MEALALLSGLFLWIQTILIESFQAEEQGKKTFPETPPNSAFICNTVKGQIMREIWNNLDGTTGTRCR